jgi:hypothetical protein
MTCHSPTTTAARAARAPTTDALYDLIAASGARAVAVIGLVKNAKYVFEGCRRLRDEVRFTEGGIIERRAHDVLRKAAEQLEEVKQIGLFAALARGMFADVQRDPHGGRGFEGVFAVGDDYFNPFFSELRNGRLSGAPVGPRPGKKAAATERGH